MQLGSIDLIVLVASVAVAIVIGLLMRGKSGSLEGFLLGDRNLPWWAILGSIVATETSTATVLSLPGQGYGPNGMHFLQIAFGLVIGRVVVVLILLPKFFDGKLSSAYDVLQKRFGSSIKYLASLLFLITRNLGDGLRLFLAAMVLQKMIGWSYINSAVTIGLVTVLYTYFGGLRSVVWNDCIQLCIYMLGAVATVFIIINLLPGGWEQLTEFAAARNKFEIFRFSPPESAKGEPTSTLFWLLSDPYTFWAGLFGGAILTLGTHGTDQMMVQRYLSARTPSHAAAAIILSGLVVLFQFAIFLFIGVQLACFYADQPDVVDKADEIYALFIVESFPKNTGLVGLMLAAIFAAAMSTLSSSLNASASAVVNDFLIPLEVTNPASQSALSITRWLAVGFGILQVAVGIWASRLDSSVISNALTIAGYAAGLLLGLFLLAVLSRSTTQTSAMIGAAAGLLTLLAAQFLIPRYGVSIAWTWFAMIGSVTTYTVGTIAALMLPDSSRNLHE